MGISRAHVLRLLSKNILPGYRLGRLWLILEHELEAYIASLTNKQGDGGDEL